MILAVGRDHFSDNPFRGGLRLSQDQGRRSPEIFRHEDDIPRNGKSKELLIFFLGSSEDDPKAGVQAEMASDVQQNKIPMGIAGNMGKEIAQAACDIRIGEKAAFRRTGVVPDSEFPRQGDLLFPRPARDG